MVRRVLALDPAFRNTGWVVVEVCPGQRDRLLDGGVIETKPANKKMKRFAGDDNHYCSQIIARKLIEIIDKWQIKFICAESQSGSKNSKAAQLMGMGWGIISAISVTEEVNVLQVRPQEIKEAVTGKRAASKGEIKLAVMENYIEIKGIIEKIDKASKHEHVYDACAVMLTCTDSLEVNLFRGVLYE